MLGKRYQLHYSAYVLNTQVLCSFGQCDNPKGHNWNTNSRLFTIAKNISIVKPVPIFYLTFWDKYEINDIQAQDYNDKKIINIDISIVNIINIINIVTQVDISLPFGC